MKNTCVIRRDYLHYVKKYNRFEKRHKNMSVHLSPCFRDVQIGDVLTVGECRPLSKTVKFNTLKVNKSSDESLKSQNTKKQQQHKIVLLCPQLVENVIFRDTLLK
ncbi:RP-S11e [Lepeophtheirus salmonis]|uniref:Small ribosomal subunit protein uS17 n=1 Tax=Lepeophtheirus salmonis TaxID=72036 RepID=A0A7R8CFZ9_LEPSM|nr:RP-S11e [Lepeophtheirus salmonis]CAF2811222.1 RP-S11e [Lepeophtheirus salmonis]